MKIIYGGSFNPPTKAHFKIGEYLLNKYPHANLIFLPTSSLYHKDELADDKDRLAMVQILCDKLGPRACVSDFEIKLDGYYGTSYTLANFPNSYFVMGADNLQSISKWINFPNVVAQNKFMIIPRDDINIDELLENDDFLKKYINNFYILNDFPKVFVSSTKYRRTKEDDLVLPEINNYIVINNLYQKE